jgi:2'-5' RNA ligase
VGIGVALYLATPREVHDIFRSVAELGVRTIADDQGQRLHLSLMNGKGGTKERLAEALGGIADRLPRTVLCSGRGFFRGRRNVLYVAVNETTRDVLEALQAECFRAATDAGIEVQQHYIPPAWTPHISIASGFTDEQLVSIEAMPDATKGVSCEVQGLGLATWSSASSITTEYEWPL